MTPGQFYTYLQLFNITGSGGGGGGGDMVGPSSATNNAVVIFNGTTGKLAENSLATIDGSGNIATPGYICASKSLNTNLVWVSPQGSDITGTGSETNPYASYTYAVAQIVAGGLATPTNPYSIFISGSISDTGLTPYVSPNINVFSPPGVSISLAHPLAADPAWATADIGTSQSSWMNVAIVGDVAVDFSSFDPSLFPIIYFTNVKMGFSSVGFRGAPSIISLGALFNFNNCSSPVAPSFDDLICEGVNNTWNGANFGTNTPSNTIQYSGNDNFTSAVVVDNSSVNSNVTMVFDLLGGSLDNGFTYFASGSNSCTASIQLTSSVLGQQISFGNDGLGDASTFYSITGCNKISQLNLDDESGLGLFSGGIDATSFPATLNLINGSPPFLLTDVANGVSCDSGLALAGRRFSWGGQSGPTALTFQCGNNGNLVSSVTLSTILGRSASTHNDVFICSDSSGSVNFSATTRQFVAMYSNGVGFQTVSPQAGFHSAKGNTDGKFLASGVGAVTTANMANQEWNPFVSGSTAAIQFKDQFGTGYTIAFTVGGGTVPFLSSANTWSGVNTFNALTKTTLLQATSTISSTTGVVESAIVSAAYTMAVSIAANDIIGGIVLATPVAPAMLQLPTFAAFEAAFAAFLGQTTVPINSYKLFSLENTASGIDVSLTGASGMVIVTQGGNPVITGLASGSFKILKDTSSSYAVFGVDSVNGSGGGGDVFLAANNILTGLNLFTGASTGFESINPSSIILGGPSVTTGLTIVNMNPSGPVSGSSVTLTDVQASSGIVTLNGSLTTQNIFLPTATALDAILLTGFPGGSSLAVGSTVSLRLINKSTTATVTVGGNTGIVVTGMASVTILPGNYVDILINKLTSGPTYGCY